MVRQSRPRSPLRFVGDDKEGAHCLVIPEAPQALSGTVAGAEEEEVGQVPSLPYDRPLASRQVLSDMALLANGLEFDFIGPIEPDRDDLGIAARHPEARYTKAPLPLNKYVAGPFCSFKVAKGHRKAGVYLIQVDKTVVYVGECQNLAARYGSGYGVISPRNCFKGGQETNCRINNLIFDAAQSGAVLSLWFREIEGGKNERLAIERGILAALRPPWNR